MTSRLIVGTFVSLDGVMQGPGGPGEDDSNGFQHGGWVAPLADEGFGRIVDGFFNRADGMLLGRRTYDIFFSYWPHQKEDFADRINSMPKYVTTRKPMDSDWTNTEVLVGDAAETVADLKKRTDGVILVQGSSDLLHALQKAELVDEYHVLVFPVVLGQGKRLFSEGTAPAGLKLTGSDTTESGIVYAAYAWAGKPEYGTIA